jgi:tetratricopeptide (TPR) repeat protein
VRRLTRSISGFLAAALSVGTALNAAGAPAPEDVLSRATAAVESAPGADPVDDWLRIAKACARAGKRDAAGSALSKALRAADEDSRKNISADDVIRMKIDKILVAYGQDRVDHGDKAGAKKVVEQALALAGGLKQRQADDLKSISALQAQAGDYRGAFAHGCGSCPPMSGCDPLEGVVLEQIQSGDRDKAEATALSIKDPEKRGYAQRDVVRARVEGGDLKGALRVAGQIEAGEERAYSFLVIAYALAASSDDAAAFAAADQAHRREDILQRIVVRQVRAGDVIAALATLDAIPSGDWSSRFNGLMSAALILRERGDGPGAEKIFAKAIGAARTGAEDARKRAGGKGEPHSAYVDSYSSTPEQYVALNRMAKAQAVSGDWKGAVATAESISFDSERISALRETAEELAEQGRFAEALEVAGKIYIDWVKVADERLKKGDRKGAAEAADRMAAQNFEWNYDRDEALSAIAQAQARKGLVAAALDTVAKMMNLENESKRMAMSEISGAQARAGDFALAIKTAQDSPNGYHHDNSDMLARLAEIEADKGDAKGAYDWIDKLPARTRAEVLLTWALGPKPQ